MLFNIVKWRRLAAAVLMVPLLLLAGAAHASDPIPPVCATVDSKLPGNWFTNYFVTPVVSGTAEIGDVVTVKIGSAPPITFTQAGTGTWTIERPKGFSGGTVTISSTNCPPAVNVTVAANFNPPDNQLIARHIVAPGSIANAGGNAFVLSGAYTVASTAVNRDPLSSGFGVVSGAILAADFQVNGSGPAGALGLHLLGDQAFSVDMLSVFNAPNPIGAFAAFHIPVSGIANLNGIDSAFDGVISGTVTYGADDLETYAYSLALQSGFGDITGTMSSSAVARVVAEPGVLSLAVLALLLSAAARHGWRGGMRRPRPARPSGRTVKSPQMRWPSAFSVFAGSAPCPLPRNGNSPIS